MKKVRNKQQIKNVIHYLIKWADWSSEYNFYELMSHLVDALKAVVDYKHKLKYKHKKVRVSNINKTLNSEDVITSHKQILRWSHMLYLIHNVLNEISKSCDFEVYFRVLTDFWVNCTTSYSVSYSFYSQLQSVYWTVESCCAKMRKCFNENWHLVFWLIV